MLAAALDGSGVGPASTDWIVACKRPSVQPLVLDSLRHLGWSSAWGPGVQCLRHPSWVTHLALDLNLHWIGV